MYLVQTEPVRSRSSAHRAHRHRVAQEGRESITGVFEAAGEQWELNAPSGRLQVNVGTATHCSDWGKVPFFRVARIFVKASGSLIRA
jgi:hypothetical protein